MESKTAEEEARKDQRANRLIPWMFVLAFLVVGAVDGVFVYLALSSHSGVVTEGAYEKGLAYNQTLAKAEEMRRLGWTLDVNLFPGNRLSALLKDRDGAPLPGAVVKGKMIRQTVEGYDYSVDLLPSPRKDGLYESPLAPPLKGAWTIRLFVTRDGSSFEKSEDLVLH